MTTRRTPRQGQKPSQRQRISSVALFREVPRDWRVSGLAFAIDEKWARNADGDWFRIGNKRLFLADADDVDEEVLVRGREFVAQILTRVM